MGKIQVYCAVSLDGFIAGPEDELDWLGEPASGRRSDPGAVEFSAFMEQTGAILMGRRTFDVVKSHGGDWPYGSVPVLVATTRPLGGDLKRVSPSRGNILELCEQARQVAGRRNVYLDGGKLISQALDSGCVDELILTVAPVFLGQGVRLYQGKRLHRFNAEYQGRLGTMLQIKLTKD